ncbi:uncharacterized protein B0I36DRAFT_23829 [Microdochium trichocladiopsis]|uniref:Uncharacterized protein n=1 Tax=Microdochium trichocladiopsis TaxID=1682393 RepID=A0A9P9BWJ1_9PEZI|nr:uncharacterized protein B0I36DRAFT_23829 [Microdochium trichocladiopsis]KAH7041473.1 hypothetical protein B0I36DRAFT_23829 [Microdochium trichocladiopsis]
MPSLDETKEMPSSAQLPPEIILLVCQELAADRALGTLYHLALTASTVAPIALEQLYSLYDISPAILGTYGKRAWGTRWRSILMSTKGRTAYPYAAYLRTLSLGGNLDDVLSEMLGDKTVRQAFFAPPLEGLLCLWNDATRAQRHTRAYGLPRIDHAVTVSRCGEAIIEYIEKLARESDVKVALAHLETNSVPSGVLSAWCRRLGPGLISLRLRDGAILNKDIGVSLASECPNFNDLTLFYCLTQSAEDNSPQDNLPAFLNELQPNTLRNFEIMSKSSIGQKSLAALSRQSKSLRSLKFSGLSLDALRALDRLTECTELECFGLENDHFDRTDLVAQGLELVSKLSAWIGRCSSLRDFRIVHGHDALHLVRDLLCTSNAPLESLTLRHFSLMPTGQNRSIFEALARHKETLRELTIGHFWDPQDSVEKAPVSFLHPETTVILDSICELKQLKVLNLQGAWVDSLDFARIVEHLPQLEELQIMSYETLEDHDLLAFHAFPNLRSLMIVTPTTFSHEALVSFVKGLDPIRQNGIQIDIMAQDRENAPWQDVDLNEHIAAVNGSITLGYARNIDGDDDDSSSDSD